MDEYMFDDFVDKCVVVYEATKYLEILNYSDSSQIVDGEHILEPDEFENFLHRRGVFAPRDDLARGTKLVSGLRLVVQVHATHNQTFAPKHISLAKDEYKSMVQAFKLPLKAIETTSVVGPFFWSALTGDEDDRYLHIVHRKSDVRKKGKTRGWELMLSHSFATGITSGYIKGTPTSDVVPALSVLRAAAIEVGHPMLLPVIVLALDLSPKNDEQQRKARDWLRYLETAVSMRDEVDDAEMRDFAATHGHPGPGGEGLVFEVDGLSRDLVECHGSVLWKRPQAYAALAKEMEKAMASFQRQRGILRSLREEKEEGEEVESDATRAERKIVERSHESLLSRIDFYQAKLQGLENYIHTTLERLQVQREALYHTSREREARLNLEIAGEQKKIAHASKRDSTAMKTLSLLGVLFLPGTYLASVFGMSFFNYEADATPVSSDIWIYIVTTVPITALIVVFWLWYDRRRERRYKEEDEKLETDIEKMEKEIMQHLRQRALNKTRTWKSSIATAAVKA